MSLDSLVVAADHGFAAAERFEQSALKVLSDFPTMIVGSGGLMLGAGLGMYAQNETSLSGIAVGVGAGIVIGTVNAAAVKGMAYISRLNNERFQRVHYRNE